MNAARERDSTFDRALAVRGMDRNAVIQALAATVILPTHFAFAYGSLVEGLGNPSSDLDVAVIVPGDSRLTPLTNQSVEVCGLQADILFLPQGRIEEWSELLRGLERATPREHALATDYVERRMMHAMLNGAKLSGSGELEDRLGFGAQHFIRHLVGSAHYWIHNLQHDLAGMASAGDYDSMPFASQELICRAADLLLADAGLTNPNPKWRAALLGRIDAPQARRFPQAGTRSLFELVYQLHRAPRKVTARSAASHARAAVTFARQALLARWLPQTRAAEPDEEISPGYPSLRLDVAFEAVPDGVAVVRLATDEEAIVIPHEHAHLLRFLGIPEGVAQPLAAAGSIMSLVRLLAARGFIDRPA